MSISIDEMWQKVVDNINLSVTPETYNLWIAPLKPLCFENDIFTVAVPNVYFSQWVENHQQKNI